ARRQGEGGLSLLHRTGVQYGGWQHHSRERRKAGEVSEEGRAEEEGEGVKESRMKICVAGQGAFGQKHLDALKRIPDVEITSLVGGNQDKTAEVAKKYGIPHHT